MPQDNPNFLALETRDGRATLGGKRRLLDDFDEAVEAADEIDGQVFAIEPIEAAPFAPVAAITHVRLSAEPISAIPDVVVYPPSSQAGLHAIRNRVA
ncbi:hypothetical protein DC31_13725 [Microbacterium sp. CH12i]|uniref:hypothetical protein n=1 Tax=Microbacterium sp. CH12i TaxID=1479651 RepID=UPI00046123A0|nr:hypothetical protein [Microbacterium sp. CH12i]KDA05547.1 hypothetical protein DC31_13725 [Microbacterium sp. CH12i]